MPHSRPYMVLLERYMQDGKTKHCGGFLLNEDFEMTAAHCMAWSVFTLYDYLLEILGLLIRFILTTTFSNIKSGKYASWICEL